MMRDTCVFLIFLTCCIHLQAHAEADGPDFWELQGHEARHLYAEATLAFPVLDTIPGATKGLKNLGCVGAVPFDQWHAMPPEEKNALFVWGQNKPEVAYMTNGS
jgi:hypothetical protein